MPSPAFYKGTAGKETDFIIQTCYFLIVIVAALNILLRGRLGRAMVLVTQCRHGLLIWIQVEQVLTVLLVGAGEEVLWIFFFSANMTLFYLSLSGRGLDIDYKTVPNMLLNPSQYFNEVSECFHLNPLFLWTGLIISCNRNDFYINLLTNTCQWCCSVYKCLYNKCTHGSYGLLYSE